MFQAAEYHLSSGFQVLHMLIEMESFSFYTTGLSIAAAECRQAALKHRMVERCLPVSRADTRINLSELPSSLPSTQPHVDGVAKGANGQTNEG